MNKLAIFNMAIGQAGGRKLLSATTERVAEAEQCNLWYDSARDTTFNASYWPEHRKTETLLLAAENDFADAWTTADPPHPWAYAYVAPAGMRHLYRLFSKNFERKEPAPPFQINNMIILETEIKVICSNQEDAAADFTQTVDDPARWNPDLALAVAMQLAAMISLPVSGKKDYADKAMQLAIFYRNRAMEVSGNTDEKPPAPEEYSAILDARGHEEGYRDFRWPSR